MDLEKTISQAHKIDQNIVDLIAKRIRLIQAIPENQVDMQLQLRHLQSQVSSTIEKKMINHFLEEIFDFALNSSKMKISFLGPFATNSHQATLDIFGHTHELLPQTNIFDIFKTVEKEEARFGVVPVENSIEGSVNGTLDQLIETDLEIFGEKTINICHHLVGNGKLDEINEIYSHPQILGQCRQWLRTNCPHAIQIETLSSAAAMEKIKDQPRKAAIGTAIAAESYQIPVIKKGIQDMKANKTRFFIIGKESRKPGKKNKTSIIFLCQDKPGALVEALKVFKSCNINLTKIESRPSKRKIWEYYFFTDLIGHKEDSNVQRALLKLKDKTIFLRILGSYPVD